MPLWLIPSTIRYVSRENCNNPGKGVSPSLTPRYSSHWKRNLRVNFVFKRQHLYIYIYKGRSKCSKIHPDFIFIINFSRLYKHHLHKNKNRNLNQYFYVCLFVCLDSWYIKFFCLFNAKSIFIQINSFISNNSVKHKSTV